MFSVAGDALLLMVTLSCIALTTVASVSGIAAIAQSAMQLQEPSIGHLVKVVTLTCLVLVLGDWAAQEVVSLFERVLRVVGEVRQVTG